MTPVTKIMTTTTSMTMKLFTVVSDHHEFLYDSYLGYINGLNNLAYVVMIGLLLLGCVMMMNSRTNFKGVLGKNWMRLIVSICFIVSVLRPIFSSHPTVMHPTSGAQVGDLKDILIDLEIQEKTIDNTLLSFTTTIDKFQEYCEGFYCSDNTHERLQSIKSLVGRAGNMQKTLHKGLSSNLLDLQKYMETLGPQDTLEVMHHKMTEIAAQRHKTAKEIIEKENEKAGAARELVLRTGGGMTVVASEDMFRTVVHQEKQARNRRGGKKSMLETTMTIETSVDLKTEEQILLYANRLFDEARMRLAQLISENERETKVYMNRIKQQQRAHKQEQLYKYTKMPARQLIKQLRADTKAPNAFEDVLSMLPVGLMKGAFKAIELAQHGGVITTEAAKEYIGWTNTMIENHEDIGAMFGSNLEKREEASKRLFHLVTNKVTSGNFIGFGNPAKIMTMWNHRREYFDPLNSRNVPLFFFIYVVAMFHNTVTLRIPRILYLVMIMLPFYPSKCIRQIKTLVKKTKMY